MKKVYKQVKIKRYRSKVKDPKRNKTSKSIIREYRDFLQWHSQGEAHAPPTLSFISPSYIIYNIIIHIVSYVA